MGTGERTTVRMVSDVHIGMSIPTSQREMDQTTMKEALEYVDKAHLLVVEVANRLENRLEAQRVRAESSWIGTLRWSIKALARWLDDCMIVREKASMLPKSGVVSVVPLGDAFEPPTNELEIAVLEAKEARAHADTADAVVVALLAEETDSRQALQVLARTYGIDLGLDS